MLVSLIAILTWDDTVLDSIQLPTGMDSDILKGEMVRKLGELNILYSDPTVFKAQLGIFSRSRAPVWNKLWSLANAEYNPIDNYKRTIIETTAHGHKEQIDYLDNSELTTNGSTRVFGFDSSESVGKDSASSTSEGENSGQNIRQHSGLDVVTTVGEGNIGVTTYQKMIAEELDVRKKLDIYSYIIEDIKKEFCIYVY